METIITAVGPDNVGLADPIVHFVTGQGANIEEIQMYNHDEAALFAMLLRVILPIGKYGELCDAMQQIGQRTHLSIRVWSPERRASGRGWRSGPPSGPNHHWLYSAHPRRTNSGLSSRDDWQSSTLPRAGRTVRGRLALCRRRGGTPG